MDSLIRTFENTELGFNIRYFTQGEDIQIVGVPVAKALGYSNPWDAIMRHVPRNHKAKLSEIMTVEDLGKHEALTS